MTKAEIQDVDQRRKPGVRRKRANLTQILVMMREDERAALGACFERRQRGDFH